MNTKLFLLLGTSLSLIPNLTFAQCVATQDCATLGYTETSCNGGKGIKCPFGNWWACIGITAEQCSELGFTYTCTGTGEIGVGNDCNGKYQGCSCDSSYQYTCTGTSYSGGSGTACGGKYTACTCTSGYEWKNGSCQQQILNGPDGEVYKCNGKVVGVRATGMDLYVALQDLVIMNWTNASNKCYSYVFCGNVKGTLPTVSQLVSIYNNKSRVNSLLSANGGTKMTEDWYWSSTYYGAYRIVNMSTGSDRDGGAYDRNYYAARPVLASF